MKKLLIVGAAVSGAAYLAKRFASSSGGPDFGRMVERMPENAPAQVDFPKHQRNPGEHGTHPETARTRGEVGRGFVAAVRAGRILRRRCRRSSACCFPCRGQYASHQPLSSSPRDRLGCDPLEADVGADEGWCMRTR